jgi:ribonucleotide monophosphatase NagD (HAD superfamily)
MSLSALHAKDAFIIDMETDIAAGGESETKSGLVLSGVAARGETGRFASRPDHILDGLCDLVPH